MIQYTTIDTQVAFFMIMDGLYEDSQVTVERLLIKLWHDIHYNNINWQYNSMMECVQQL